MFVARREAMKRIKDEIDTREASRLVEIRNRPEGFVRKRERGDRAVELFQVFGRLICIEYIECMFREDVN
jgi:hypothetical protein